MSGRFWERREAVERCWCELDGSETGVWETDDGVGGLVFGVAVPVGVEADWVGM